LLGYCSDCTLSNAFYNVDQVYINGSQHVLTAGGIYNAQYLDWFNSNADISLKTLHIANYSSTLPADSNGTYYDVSTLQGLQDMLGFAENTTLSFKLKADIDLSLLAAIPA